MEPEGSTPEVYTNTRVGGPLNGGPTAVCPRPPLWWDGWTVASNASDADAEATFRALTQMPFSRVFSMTRRSRWRSG